MSSRPHKLLLMLVLCIWLGHANRANAEQDRMTESDWDGLYPGKCSSSLMDYFKEIWWGQGNDAEIEETMVRRHGIYTLVSNYPSRNPDRAVLRKTGKGEEECIILYAPGADTLEWIFSPSNELIGFESRNFIYDLSVFPATVIVYKQGDKGYFEPSECKLSFYLSGKDKHYPCHEMPNLSSIYKEADLSVFPPSFDCAKSNTTAEKLICASAKLAVLDEALDLNYKNIRAADLGGKREQLLAEQRAWLKRRNNCKNFKCLDGAYRTRLNELCENYLVQSSVKPLCISSEMLQFPDE